MLIAITILAAILSLLFTSFFQIADGTAKLNERNSEQQELRLLMKLIGDDLQAIHYLNGFGEPGQGKTGIDADTNNIDGVEYSPFDTHVAQPAKFFRGVAPEADPGLHEVGYRVEPDDENETNLLLLRREDFYLDDDIEEGGISFVMAEGVQKFLLELLPANRGATGQEPPWETRWDSSQLPKNQRMPLAFRLTLARKTTSGEVLEEVLEVNHQPSLKVTP
ncbi:MAG: hypothetical protein IIA14_14560 [SAR324 cluster bacterium]|nr:hypothetical protein [SAR324 cluster bacterium]